MDRFASSTLRAALSASRLLLVVFNLLPVTGTLVSYCFIGGSCPVQCPMGHPVSDPLRSDLPSV